MEINSVNITEVGKVSITSEELNYLQSFLDVGDRGGFYIALYNMTGNDGAILQGQISTLGS